MMTRQTAQIAQGPLGNTKNQGARARSYSFTVWNWNEDSYERLKRELHTAQATRWVIGKEVAPTTQNLHLQGYVRWKDGKTVKRTIDILSTGCLTGKAHVEVCKGNEEQNYKYCIKDGNFESSGFEKEEKPVSEYGRHLDEHMARVMIRFPGVNENDYIERVMPRCTIVILHRELLMMGDYWNLETREEKRIYAEKMELFWNLWDTCTECKTEVKQPLVDRW